MPAFYKACGETLVANDPVETQRMAFSGQRYRVVALSGEVFERHGTMSGGGSKPKRGAMGVKPTVRMNESVISEDEVHEMEEQSNELRAKMREIDDTIRSLGSKIRQFSTDVTKKSNRLEQIVASQANHLQTIKLVKSRIPEKEKLVNSLTPK